MQANRTEILLGETVTFQTDFESEGSAVDNEAVELWRLPYEGEWELHATDTTNFFGSASETASPRKRTAYQWRFPGDETVGYTESPSIVVRVHAKVTIAVRDTSLRTGQRLVVKGRTIPAKPGVRITLWRARISGGDERWFSGTVHNDGTYRLTRTMRGADIGRLRLYTRIPGSTGNLNGVSPSVWIDVD